GPVAAAGRAGRGHRVRADRTRRRGGFGTRQAQRVDRGAIGQSDGAADLYGDCLPRSDGSRHDFTQTTPSVEHRDAVDLDIDALAVRRAPDAGARDAVVLEI